MQKRTSKLDTVQNAKRVFDEAVSRVEEAPPVMDSAMISQVMAAMGAKGGRIGGKRRLETMTDTQRTRIAKKAAKARWSKARSKQ
jgi:hypothetical protein